MVDALWSYESVAQAAEAKERLAQFEVGWLECPLIPEELEGHAQLAILPGVPIALGENFFTCH
jgi:L-alanine-DL-glutamate epimerase-like enolase superfamily enzyme